MEFRNHLLAALEQGDIQALSPSLTEVSLARGQSLFEPGDDVEQVYFPSSAVLSVLTVMVDGSAVESSSIGCESGVPLIGALAGEPVHSRIFAQVGGGAMRMPALALRARAQASPVLARLLMRHVAAITFQAEQGVACNILHDAPARLARWLLMTQDRAGSKALPLTQEYMAIMTGVQRTTINAVAAQLRADGLIRYTRGMVDIVDRPGLEATACECYGAVSGAFEHLSELRRRAEAIPRRVV